MKLVDSHCHLDCLDLEKYNGNLSQALKAAQDEGVEHFLCVCIELDQFDAMCDLVDGFDNVSVSAGIHPLHVKDAVLDMAKFERLASQSKVVALGETGLDYYYSKDNKIQQQHFFRQHLRLAAQLKKPVIIHTRDAKQDTLDILREDNGPQIGGVLHCFTEDVDMATQAIEMGFYISFSGIISFNNAARLRQVVAEIPLRHMLVETDSPYLTPAPHRGKPNEPRYVRRVAQCVAEIKGISYDEVIETTGQNFVNLFGLE